MIRYWPNFVCELCTVRAVLGHELESMAEVRLLSLERMRLLDLAWYLAENTHKTYQTKLGQMMEFQYCTSMVWPFYAQNTLNDRPEVKNLPLCGARKRTA